VLPRSFRSHLTRRRGLPRLLAVGTLALVAGGITAGVVARANDLADDYGTRDSVPTAVRDLAVGHEIGDADVAWRSLPVGLVGGTALDRPIGRIVAAPILRDEAIVAERVGPDGLRGPMAIAPEDSRAVAIPVGDTRPPVEVGDLVDVVAVSLNGLSRADRIASSAVVVALNDEAVTVAVDRGEVPATARAVLEGTAVIALVGAG
jgi:Flp pilus assembly protein CpaB